MNLKQMLAIFALFLTQLTNALISDNLASLTEQISNLSIASTKLQQTIKSKEEFYKCLESDIELALQNKNLDSFAHYPTDNSSTQTAKFILNILLNNKLFIDSNFVNFGTAPFIIAFGGMTPPPKRIILILKLIEDVKELYPDKSQFITIASVGAGELLQDYILLRSLIFNDYKFINFNAIEPGANVPLFSLQVSLQRDGFKKCINKTDPNCTINLLHWQSGFEYIKNYIKNPKYPTNICYMVDPSTGISYGSFKLIEYGKTNYIRFRAGYLTPSDAQTDIAIPFNIDNSFIIDYSKDLSKTNTLICNLNKTLESTPSLISAINTITIPGKFLSVGRTDNISISFFDIIKETSPKNKDCIAYVLFGKTTKFENIKNLTYYEFSNLLDSALDNKDTDKNIWIYNQAQNQFIKK